MSVLTRAQLQTAINTLIATNGNQEITGAVLNGVLNDIVDSLASLLTDVGELAFVEYSTTKDYQTGELTYYLGNFYISLENQSSGVFTSAKWLKLSNLNGQADYNLWFDIYSELTTYNIGDGTFYNNQFYICDANGTISITPADASPNWSLVYAHNGDRSRNWQAGYYLNGQIVRVGNESYVCIKDTTLLSFNSTTSPNADPTNWEVFNKAYADSLIGANNELSEILANGNTTGGSDILISADDKIVFNSSGINKTVVSDTNSTFRVELDTYGGDETVISNDGAVGTSDFSKNYIYWTQTEGWFTYGVEGGKGTGIINVNAGSTNRRLELVLAGQESLSSGNYNYSTVNVSTYNSAISSKGTALNGATYNNSVFLGGTNGVINKSEYAFAKNLEVQGGVLRYSSTPALATALDMAHKGYVDAQVDGYAALSPVTQIAFADSPYTAVWGEDLEVDCTAGAVTINLPTAVGNNGKTINVTKVDVSVNAVTVDGNGAQTINGSATSSQTTQYESYTYKSNNTNVTIR